MPVTSFLPPGYVPTGADIDTLTRTLWGEARGESRDGQVAIIHVVLNRLRSPGWWSRDKGDGIPDDTIAAVCRDPWQFSAWNASDPNRDKLEKLKDSDPVYRRLRAVVTAVLAGGQCPDPTGGATHYKVHGVHTAWAVGREPTARIGSHDFYRVGLNG